MTQNFTLTWHSYASHFQNIISELYTTGELSDVTLVCDDQVRYKVHKFVLKAYSSVFKNLLEEKIDSKSIIYLRG